jgi:hypothetical protein
MIVSNEIWESHSIRYFFQSHLKTGLIYIHTIYFTKRMFSKKIKELILKDRVRPLSLYIIASHYLESNIEEKT